MIRRWLLYGFIFAAMTATLGRAAVPLALILAVLIGIAWALHHHPRSH
jgi:hypothetical protein